VRLRAMMHVGLESLVLLSLDLVVDRHDVEVHCLPGDQQFFYFR
jgi:hypothetical protein